MATCQINKSYKGERGKCDKGAQNYSEIKFSCLRRRRYASQLFLCGCCSVFRSDHSSLDFTAFQPRAAGSSFRSSGAAIHALRDSLHSRSPIGRLFHSRERRDREGSSLPRAGIAVLPTRRPAGATFDVKNQNKRRVAHSVYEQNKAMLLRFIHPRV